MVVGDFTTSVETVIIGGGPGGYVAAIRAAQLGQEVAIIEKEHLGGMCLNWGCIPSKALIEASGLKKSIENANIMGLSVSGLQVDMQQMHSWKDDIIHKLRGGISGLLDKHGVEVIQGTATFSEPGRLFVETREGLRRYEYKNVIIATGSRPIQLPHIPVDGEIVINVAQALSLPQIPEKFLIVGAGSVGIELGTVYAKLGSQVTIVEAQDKLLPQFEPEIGRTLQKSLKKNNIDLKLGTTVQDVLEGDSGAEVKIKTGERTDRLVVDKILVAIGHQPNTDELGLETISLSVDDRGFIAVNDEMQTSVENVYAIGDVVEGLMLAHRASHMGKVAAEVIAGRPSAFDNLAIPGVIFSDPEIATVGLTEAEARAQDYNVKTGVFPFKALGRALTMGDAEGMTKIVSDADSGAVLGVHIVGPHASDLIAEGALAVETGAHLDDLTLTIHAHPTLPEGLGEAAEAVEHKAIHIFQSMT